MLIQDFTLTALVTKKMISIFKMNNFKTDVKNIIRWTEMPIKINKINKIFRDTPEDILKIKVFDVILKK